MNSQAFIDESGGANLPSLVVGGFVAPCKTWKLFSEDWIEILDIRPQWPDLHTKDWWRHEVLPWRNYESEDRERRMMQLIDLVHQHALRPFAAIVDMPRFREAQHPEIYEIHKGKPYLLAAAPVITNMLHLHESIGRDLGKVDFIFDYHQEHMREVKSEIEDVFIPNAKVDNPSLFARLGTTIWPRPDERERYVPLQAADMFVWHLRHGRDERGGDQLPTWKRLIGRQRGRIKFLGYADGDEYGMSQLFSNRIEYTRGPHGG